MDTTIFGMNLFHKDLYELLGKFGLDLVVVFLLIRRIYYPIHKKKENLFTYFLFNILIFFLCILMNNVKLSMGFGFGLFAVFSILRYRTEQITVKDMTYLFAVITLAVVNALVGKKVSLSELVFTNAMILACAYLLERMGLTQHEGMHELLYDRIDLLKPANRRAMLADLHERLGLQVLRVEIGPIDLLKETVRLRVFYALDANGPIHYIPTTNGGDD